MRAALLVPEPATGYPWQSAFDGEANALARVGIIVIGTDGEPCIMELELIEPALFLEHSPDRGAAFAQAIASAAQSAVEQKLADR